jgi:hypothetical protein
VLTQIRGEDLHNRAVVLLGLTGDPLLCIDTAESDIELLAAELIDRPSRSFLAEPQISHFTEE